MSISVWISRKNSNAKTRYYVRRERQKGFEKMKRIFIMLLVLCCLFMNTTSYAAMILEYDGGVHNYTGAVCTL